MIKLVLGKANSSALLLLPPLTASEEQEVGEEPTENGDKDPASAASTPRQESPPIDNRNLLDRDENQRLCRDDIEELRSQGLRGHEIVGHLVNNSLTFKGKTEYSRQKYVNRKKKKHFSLLIILKPSTRLLCEMYYSKNPSKLCGLRIDTLTQMLLHSNVRAGSQLMIVESALGMVVGAAMERMGGIGKLVHFYAGSAAQKPAYVGFDFPESFHENYYEFPLDRVKELLYDDNIDDDEKKEKEISTAKEDNEDNASANKQEASMETDEGAPVNQPSLPTVQETKEEKSVMPNTNADAASEDLEEDVNSSEPPKKKFRRNDDPLKETRRQMRADRLIFAKDLIRRKNMDGLIFCSRYHPTPIVEKLIEFVAPSRPIVIFNQFREPLIDVYNRLKNKGNVVNLKLSESWMREYQVLPGRTHPLMQMSGGGGFLLTGYVVEASS